MTNKQGWIQLHRTLQDNPIWSCEPFTKGQAWVDLLMLANHKDGYILIDGQRIDIKRGQLGWSALNLSKRWKWSRGKTTRYLKMLNNDFQIELKPNNRNTIITICNYNKYQSRDTTDSTTRDTTDGQHVVQQTDTNNNVNNKNNENKYKWQGKIIKLTAKDYDQWKKSYFKLDLNAELQALDDFYSQNNTHDWYIRCSTALANKHSKKPKPETTPIVRGGFF